MIEINITKNVIKYLNSRTEKPDIYVTTCLENFFDKVYEFDYDPGARFRKKSDYIDEGISRFDDHYGVHCKGLIYINEKFHDDCYNYITNCVMIGDAHLHNKYGKSPIESKIISLIHEYCHYELDHDGHGRHDNQFRRLMNKITKTVFTEVISTTSDTI